MLEYLNKLAIRLNFLQWPMIAVGLVCVPLFFVFLFSGEQYEQYLVPSLMGLLWSLVSLSFIKGFVQAPPLADSQAGMLQRLKIRIKRGLFYLLGIAMMVMSLLVLYISIRLIRVLI